MTCFGENLSVLVYSSHRLMHVSYFIFAHDSLCNAPRLISSDFLDNNNAAPLHNLFWLTITVTLNYCAALGLIEVGVLPKPGKWEHHRMKNPAKPNSNPHAVKNAKVVGKTIDISHVDSDDEDWWVIIVRFCVSRGPSFYTSCLNLFDSPFNGKLFAKENTTSRKYPWYGARLLPPPHHFRRLLVWIFHLNLHGKRVFVSSMPPGGLLPWFVSRELWVCALCGDTDWGAICLCQTSRVSVGVGMPRFNLMTKGHNG